MYEDVTTKVILEYNKVLGSFRWSLGHGSTHSEWMSSPILLARFLPPVGKGSLWCLPSAQPSQNAPAGVSLRFMMSPSTNFSDSIFRMVSVFVCPRRWCHRWRGWVSGLDIAHEMQFVECVQPSDDYSWHFVCSDDIDDWKNFRRPPKSSPLYRW